MDDDRGIALLRSIAAHGLCGVLEPDPVAVTPVTWNPLLGRLREQGLTGMAVDSVAAGWLDLTEQQTDELLSAHRRAMIHCLSVERKLLGLSAAFHDAGIAFAVLKGPSIAHSAYRDPSLRAFADLDLLVSTDDYTRTSALFDRIGYIRRVPEPRPGFDTRFGKASVHENPYDGIEVDLHRTLVLGPFGLWLDTEELLRQRGSFQVGGRSLPRLDDTGLLLNVALHAALGSTPPRLVPLRDVLQMSFEGDIDWDRLLRWGREWHQTAVLRFALMTAVQLFAAPIPAGAHLVLEEEPPQRETRLLGTYVGGSRRHGGIPIATLGALPGFRSKLAYAWALGAPRREFLLARGGAHGSLYIWRWSVPARWIAGRITRFGRFRRGTRPETRTAGSKIRARGR